MPDDILSWMDSFGTRKKQKINQCELLAVIAAVMTFGDIFRDRELLVWVDNVPALNDDDPFIVLTETKFSFRCIPVWIGTLLTGLGSKKNTCDNVLTMTSTVPW